MKIQNNKTKILSSVIASVLLVFMLSSPTMVAPNAHALSQSFNQDCLDKVEALAGQQAQLLDENKAKSLAQSNSEFMPKTKDYTINGSSVYNMWKIDWVNCMPIWKGSHVVYYLKDKSANMVNLDFALDPSLANVTNVQQYKTGFAYYNSPTWDGYEFYDGSVNHYNIWQSQGIFTFPTLSQPPSGQPQCKNPICSLVIWTGLEDTNQASDGALAQTGAYMHFDCNANPCSSSGHLFYEYLPNAITSCGTPSDAVSSGDQVSAKVTSHGKSGGTATLYDFYTADTTNNNLCSVNSVSVTNLSNPLNAPMMDERECTVASCSSAYSLPKFGSDSITGYVYYNSALNSISAASAYEDQMWTPKNVWTTHNMQNHGGYGTGSFTEAWQDSTNS